MPNHQNDNLFEFLNKTLNEFRHPAPEKLWEGINHDLNELSPQAPQEYLDQHLHQEFKQFHQKAPLNLWDNIAEDLPEELSAPEITTALDDKVKASYQAQIEAPENIWWSIEQQLNIDGIWRNMTPQLDQLRSSYRWKTRLRQISVAALLLLLIRGCGFIPEFHLGNTTPSEMVELTTESSSTKQQSILPIHKSHNDNSATLDENNPEERNTTLNNSAQTVNSNQKPAPKHQHSAAKLVPILHQKISHDLPNLLNKATANNDLSGTELRPIQEFLANNYAEPAQGKIDLIAVPLIAPKPLAQKDKDIIVLQNKSNIKFRPYVELGAVVAIRKSILINDANTKSIVSQTNKPINSIPDFTPSYGISADYYYAPRSALSINLWLNSKLRKEYQYHYNNRNASTNVEANYLKVSIANRFGVIRYGNKSQNSFDLKAGAYLARLKSSKISYINRPPQIAENSFNNWDGGIVFTLGQTHKFKSRLAFEYGVRSELGLGSIFSNNKGPISTMLGFSAYSALRYRF